MSGKNKADAEKFQRQLLELLKDEPNRVCADCHARGPRWASWNLGVFICIRCAGMHRNLGVHIAKVKSVNLDTWTQEQVDNMLAWGNGIANEYYEYKLPPDFRRPKDDSEVEKLIRNKYDKKLYIHENFDYANSVKQHPVSAGAGDVVTKPSSDVKKTSARVEPAQLNAPTKNIPVVPLMTRSEAYVPPKVTAPKPAVKKPASAEQPSLLQVSLESTAPAPSIPTSLPPSSTNTDLVDLFGDMVSSAPATTASPSTTSDSNLLQETAKEEPKKSVKDSIMSLYGASPPGGFQSFGGGNNMMLPQQQVPASGSAGFMQPGMMGSQFPQQFNSAQNSQFPSNPQQQHQFSSSNLQQQQQFPSSNLQNNGGGNMAMMQQQQFGVFGGQQFGQQFNTQHRAVQPNDRGFMQNGTQQQQPSNVMNTMVAGGNTFPGQTFNNNAQRMNSGMQPMNNGQTFNTGQTMGNGLTMGNGQGMYMMGSAPQQFGFGAAQNPVNQQQHLDSIQRQLQQLKVGQQNWAQASGSG